MKFIIIKIKQICKSNQSIEAECTRINVRHILIGSPVAASINSLLILSLGFSPTSNNASSLLWKHSLIITHGLMMVCMLICFLIANYIRKNGENLPLSRFLQLFVMTVICGGGIALASIDQLVTTSITPYILVNLTVGAFLLIRPIISLFYYISSFTIFYFLIALNNLPSDMLLSSRINGIAAAILGFLLTIILWRHNQINITQRKYIIEQSLELEEANRKLEKMAFFDSLTGLPNRQYFDQVLQKEISQNSRMGSESYLIMLDIDLFKSINDMYGHPVGDALLIEIGKLLSDNIRKYDTLCRLGGEEFLLLLPKTTADEALSVAEKLRCLLEQHTFFITDHILHITASFGVARLSYTSDPKVIAQYAKVDNALYLAKQCGRNCVKSA